jgi:ABC-type polysaccharide/polyol phosphate transport system ATPase subunit
MENREIAIQLSGVRKMYKLGQIGGGTLQGDLQSWWARIRGREDPNTKIGSTQRLVGQTFMALNGIDLIVYKGEALGIIGGNGAGKSTMLKLLSRVTAPSAGEIDIYGRIASMLEVGTGFNGEMTGRENIYMNGAILGMTKAEIDAKMGNIVEFSEVGDFIDTPVKRYSSGMYVKLAFSVAAHLDSEIMIMDEVLAVGDMAFQKKCLDKMRDAANKQGRTVLYVSHNMNTIRQLCDRCIVLDKGKIVFDGDVEEAIEVYIGESSSTSSFQQWQSCYCAKSKPCGNSMSILIAKKGIICK